MGIEKRGEPRFPVTSPIRVIVPGTDGHTIESTLIDISGTGMRFIAPEMIEAENLVGVEVDSRLILVEVRYCQPRGARFVVGARRIHEIAKDAQLSDAPAVVSEMLGHLRRHITAANGRDTQTMAMEALERIVERRENPQAPPHALEAQPQPVIAEPKQDHVPTAAPNPEPDAQPVEHDAAPPQPEPPVVDPFEAARNALVASEDAKAKRQRTIGGSRKIRIVLALAASLVIAAILVFLMLQRESEANPPPPIAAAPAEVTPAPLKPEIHHAQIRMLKPTWLSLAVDSENPLKSVFETNDLHPFDFLQGATLRVADGAAVEITVDGRVMGQLQEGPQIVQIKSSGVELVK